jgi:hypothetical protein
MDRAAYSFASSPALSLLPVFSRGLITSLLLFIGMIRPSKHALRW